MKKEFFKYKWIMLTLLFMIAIVSCRKEIINYSKFGQDKNSVKLLNYSKISDSIVNFQIRKSFYFKEAVLKFISKDSGILKYSFPLSNNQSDSIFDVPFNTYVLRDYFSNSTDKILVEFFAVDLYNQIWRDSIYINHTKSFAKIRTSGIKEDSLVEVEFSKNVMLKSADLSFYDESSGIFKFKQGIPNNSKDSVFSYNVNRYKLRQYFGSNVEKIKAVSKLIDVHGNVFFDSFSFNHAPPSVKIIEAKEFNDSMLSIKIGKNVILKQCRLQFSAKDSSEVKFKIDLDGSKNDLTLVNQINHLALSRLFSAKVEKINIVVTAQDISGNYYSDEALISKKTYSSVNGFFNSINGLIAFWELKNDLIDDSKFKNNGIANGNIEFKKIPNTPFDGAYFDGNSFIQVKHSDSVNPTEYSICAFICTEKNLTHPAGRIISKRELNGWGNSFELGTSYNNNNSYNINTEWTDSRGNNSNTSSSANHIYNVAYNVCMTHSATENAIYIDGVLTAKKTSYGTISNGNNLDITIGSRGNGNLFTGYMRDVAIWNRAISESEVQKVASLYK